MFTGIVEAVGVVKALRTGADGAHLEVAAPLAAELAAGQSVAVDGACLTVRDCGPRSFAVDVSPATLERTIASRYVARTPVNLERAAVVGDRIDGHIVQGHVDARARFNGAVRSGNTRFLEFRLPEATVGDMVPQGSVALNGVSLTVSRLGEDGLCEVAVIPYTWTHTNLRALRSGDAVNVETDLIGKYVRRAVRARTTPSDSGGHGL